mmetsp:Transcript_104556/g.294634  ORF Transcript_104556/g.294634 Transcript_104556/m.294634 type:complete len:223 (-) Transcript_104556:1150-1818(-)
MPMKMVSAVAAAPPGPLVHAMRAKSCQQQRRPPNQSGMPRLAGRAGHRWRRRQTFIDRSTTNVSRRWFVDGRLIRRSAQFLRACACAACSTHRFGGSAHDATARGFRTGGSAPNATPLVGTTGPCLCHISMRSRGVLATAWAAPAHDYRQPTPATVAPIRSQRANPLAGGPRYVGSRGLAKCLGSRRLKVPRMTAASHVGQRWGTGARVRCPARLFVDGLLL